MGSYLVPVPSTYSVPAQPEDETLDSLLSSHREGLEALAARLADLVAERQHASEEIIGDISKDQIYLENLVLDRYRWGARPTDDQTYVRLRLEQIRSGQGGTAGESWVLARHCVAPQGTRRTRPGRRREPEARGASAG